MHFQELVLHNDLFKEGTKKGYTFSDLVIKAVYNAQQSYVKSINQNFNLSLSNNSTKVLSKIGVTPMIGVNDTSFGVFTLEDAKELYNFANKADLSFISM
ncbi:hypothetical protein FQR65_LT18634 [Abscondita terminalis]|nr:hypothetical protein FQR65_LT18634 [Abscondita terminalis]